MTADEVPMAVARVSLIDPARDADETAMEYCVCCLATIPEVDMSLMHMFDYTGMQGNT